MNDRAGGEERARQRAVALGGRRRRGAALELVDEALQGPTRCRAQRSHSGAAMPEPSKVVPVKTPRTEPMPVAAAASARAQRFAGDLVETAPRDGS